MIKIQSPIGSIQDFFHGDHQKKSNDPPTTSPPYLYYNELCSQNLAQEHKVLTSLLCSINQTTYKILAMITGENIYHIYTTRGISQDSRQNDSKLLLLNLLCL